MKHPLALLTGLLTLAAGILPAFPASVSIIYSGTFLSGFTDANFTITSGTAYSGVLTYDDASAANSNDGTTALFNDAITSLTLQVAGGPLLTATLSDQIIVNNDVSMAPIVDQFTFFGIGSIGGDIYSWNPTFIGPDTLIAGPTPIPDLLAFAAGATQVGFGLTDIGGPGNAASSSDTTLAAIPEPSRMVLALLGIGAVLVRRRRP